MCRNGRYFTTAIENRRYKKIPYKVLKKISSTIGYLYPVYGD